MSLLAYLGSGHSKPLRSMRHRLIRCVWRFQTSSRVTGLRFPFKLSKNGTEHSRRIAYSPAQRHAPGMRSALASQFDVPSARASVLAPILIAILVPFGSQVGY